MQSSSEPLAIRAWFPREGQSDILFELHRTDHPTDFLVVEDGRTTGLFYSSPSPQQALSGNSRPLTLREAWIRCTAKRFPDASGTRFEELSV
jgi:hypothetical protein